MHRSSLYRVCGPAIVVGGITLLAAFSLRPLAPETIIATGDFDLSKWVVANWMFAIGSVILLGGWIGLTEHLNDAIVEGWSTLGLGGVVIGCVGLAVAGAVDAESLPRLLDSNSPERAAQAYFTITMMMDALGMMAWTMLWIGTALSGLAIAEDDEYPHRLGYSGLAIAVIEISTQLMKPDTLLHDAFGILGCVWLVSVGFIFSRIDRTSAALTSADASLV